MNGKVGGEIKYWYCGWENNYICVVCCFSCYIGYRIVEWCYDWYKWIGIRFREGIG